MRTLPELTTHVGKESNKLEEVESGLEHDPDEVWTEYADPTRDPWMALVLPVLRLIPAKELAAATGLSERSVKAIRNGHTVPRPGTRDALLRAAADFARDQVREVDATTAPVQAAAQLEACLRLIGGRQGATLPGERTKRRRRGSAPSNRSA